MMKLMGLPALPIMYLRKRSGSPFFFVSLHFTNSFAFAIYTKASEDEHNDAKRSCPAVFSKRKFDKATN